MKKQLYVAICLSLGSALSSFAMPAATNPNPSNQNRSTAHPVDAAFLRGLRRTIQHAPRPTPQFRRVSQIVAEGQSRVSQPQPTNRQS